jgi:tripartite-type tricarboxylate transporter receptor subunit TctC
MNRRELLSAGFGAFSVAGVSAFSPALLAQGKFPNKPIKYIVPYAAGGGGDLIARFLAQKLSDRFGSPVVVENKVGAGGNIGADFVLKSAPDGYTLLAMSSTYPIQAAVTKLPFDPIADMTPVIMISRDPVLILVNQAFPARTLAELVEIARKDPGKLTYGSAGVGSLGHMAVEEMNYVAGIKMTHVPYKGSSQAFSDLLGGSVNLMLTSTAFGAPYIKSGRVKGLVLSGPARVPTLPEVPTFIEVGYPQYEVYDWKAVAGPRGIPPEIIALLNAEFNAILRDKAVAGKLESDGIAPVGGTPEAMLATIRSDIARWKAIAEKAQVRIE